jgi:hypothetical protein
MSQKLQPKDGLAGAWAANQYRGPAARQTAVGDLVKPGDAGLSFGWPISFLRSAGFHLVINTLRATDSDKRYRGRHRGAARCTASQRGEKIVRRFIGPLCAQVHITNANRAKLRLAKAAKIFPQLLCPA